MKVIKSSKEFLDSALDEVRLLQYVKDCGAAANGLVEIHDYFYYREHLMILFPLLGEDLFVHFDRRSRAGMPNDYSTDVLRDIAGQTLRAVAFLHALQIYHLDIKPENVLLQKGFVGGLAPPQCVLVDLGSASFSFDKVHQYIQSRSYRAPELMMGSCYDGRADVWSLGGVLAECAAGRVLFPNHQVPTMLARMCALLGPFTPEMALCGRASQKYLSLAQAVLLDKHVLQIENGLLEQWLFGHYDTLDGAQMAFSDFVRQALTLDPTARPTAAMLLQHPFVAE